eukprot:6205595-Pleurochrysis_carterae.AAC.4
MGFHHISIRNGNLARFFPNLATTVLATCQRLICSLMIAVVNHMSFLAIVHYICTWQWLALFTRYSAHHYLDAHLLGLAQL